MKKILILTFLFLLTISPCFSDDIEDATVYYNEAIDVYSQDDIPKSIELFKKALELNPNFYEARYNLAQILMSQEENEEALKILKEILTLRPNDTETLYNIGKIQYKRGYLSDSFNHLKKIPETAPQYESAKILITKIEKRQNELNLEAKISEHKILLDNQGRALAVELGEITAPSGVAIDSRGNIYSASFSENVIYKISIYGQKTVFARSNLIKGPIGLAIDKDNNIYAANYSANTIVKIKPNATASVFAVISKPYCLLYDSEHDRLYATEQNSNKLVKFDL
ncbi:MAG: tetratricopeptide repeat protein [Candidatus Gastranaerophilales bacterium]|nr:tetratricopeptide repeat protein [Candidatus Gastranaerophilales bacterium]